MQYFGPLKIDMVATPGGGAIGMMPCPGRCIAPWNRKLADDLAAIEAWGGVALVSLIEGKEFAALGVPQFAQAMLSSSLGWHHIPIPDMETPGEPAFAALRECGPTIIETLTHGSRIVVHCAAGLGRTGMMTAKILVALGVEPAAAIRDVRRARPGTIETEEQLEFVRTGRWLSVTAPSAPDRRS